MFIRGDVRTHGSDGEQVEDTATVHPGIGVAVLSEALVVETIHLRNLPRLVIAAQQSYSIKVPSIRSNRPNTPCANKYGNIHITNIVYLSGKRALRVMRRVRVSRL